MEFINIFQIAIGSLISGAPVYLVQIVGIVVAAQKLSSSPRRARLALSGLLVSMINSFVSTVSMSAIPMIAFSRNFGATNVGIAVTVLSIFFGIVAAVGWGLVIMAIFASEKAD